MRKKRTERNDAIGARCKSAWTFGRRIPRPTCNIHVAHPPSLDRFSSTQSLFRVGVWGRWQHRGRDSSVGRQLEASAEVAGRASHESLKSDFLFSAVARRDATRCQNRRQNRRHSPSQGNPWPTSHKSSRKTRSAVVFSSFGYRFPPRWFR